MNYNIIQVIEKYNAKTNQWCAERPFLDPVKRERQIHEMKEVDLKYVAYHLFHIDFDL